MQVLVVVLVFVAAVGAMIVASISYDKGWKAGFHAGRTISGTADNRYWSNH